MIFKQKKCTKMKKYFYSVFCSLLVGVMVTSCSSDSDDDVPSSLFNTWMLVSYGNESNEILKEAKGYYYIMTFNPDGTYTGTIYGGNKMWGEYVIRNSQMTIDPPCRTKVLYEGADTDEFFLGHISEVYTYMVTSTELRLYYSDNQYFKFRIKNN